MPAQKTKICTRCKKRLKVERFYKDKSAKDCLTCWCKSCTLDYDRAYRARKKAEAVA
jgi:hypothetical protein